MQKIFSYKVIFYDEDDKEVEVNLPSHIYSDIDQAIYDWEMETDVID
tara:strand:+ start:479 stop:619 length:141 start_codon:yes stop_codon:yes gene_type:complete